jgi:hypothetical protein
MWSTNKAKPFRGVLHGHVFREKLNKTLGRQATMRSKTERWRCANENSGALSLRVDFL